TQANAAADELMTKGGSASRPVSMPANRGAIALIDGLANVGRAPLGLSSCGDESVSTAHTGRTSHACPASEREVANHRVEGRWAYGPARIGRVTFSKTGRRSTTAATSSAASRAP